MCSPTKVDVVPFPTLTFNKRTIIETIDVLQAIAIRFGLIDKIVSNKVVMMRENLLTILNAQQSIFHRQNELFALEKFD